MSPPADDASAKDDLFLDPLMGTPLAIYVEKDVDNWDEIVKLITVCLPTSRVPPSATRRFAFYTHYLSVEVNPCHVPPRTIVAAVLVFRAADRLSGPIRNTDPWRNRITRVQRCSIHPR